MAVVLTGAVPVTARGMAPVGISTVFDLVRLLAQQPERRTATPRVGMQRAPPA